MADQVVGSPSDLATAGQLGLGMQEKKLQQQGQNQDEINNASALPRGVAAAAVQQQMEKITITPEMAKGLKGVTGQDWDSAVGTKWDPKVFTPTVSSMAKAKYHQDLLGDRDKLEEMRETAKQREEDKKDKDAQDRQDKDNAAKKAREDAALAAKAKAAKNKTGSSVKTSEPSEDKEFSRTYRGYQNDLKGMNGTMLSNMAKTDPAKAKEFQDKQIFLQKNQDRFNKINGVASDKSGGADDEKKTKATKILQDAGKPVTDANIKHVMDQLQ